MDLPPSSDPLPTTEALRRTEPSSRPAALDPAEGPDAPGSGVRPGYTFGCDDCTLLHSEHCSDCLVTYLCDDSGDAPVVVSLEEIRLVRQLQSGGLVPPSRHRRASGSPH